MEFIVLVPLALPLMILTYLSFSLLITATRIHKYLPDIERELVEYRKDMEERQRLEMEAARIRFHKTYGEPFPE